MKIEEKIKKYIEDRRLLEGAKTVVIGVSGGADSVCLLEALQCNKEEYEIQIAVVHVNHNLRGEEALRDEDFVKKMCQKYGIPYYSYNFDVHSIAKKEKWSLEEAGRIVRKKALEEVARKYEGAKIATAHHKNDNAETFLMNVARGTGLSGMGGIRPKNGIWIRPLLCVDRDEVEEYLMQKKIDYCVDSTNAENIYTRNYVRNRVIPELQEYVNEQVVKHVDQVIREVEEVEAYLQKCVDEHWKSVACENDQGIELYCQELLGVPIVIRKKIVKRALALVANQEKDIARIHVEQVLELLRRQSGRRVELPYMMIAEREYGKIKIFQGGEEIPSVKMIELKVPGCMELPGGDRISTEIIILNEGKGKIRETPYTKYFDYDIMKGNLTLRNRLPGDNITIDNEGSKQKLKKFFINAKIPKKEREKALVVAKDNKILWVVEYRRGHDYPVTEKTRQVLKIQLEKKVDR